eukprot:TRINITY_DN268_c0_g2_i1.p1 TRINITY_DN268_c0_g2~~TRINITY_DN268_c0_g2_i1.p1  ORF type:complete len:447 (-),score=121.50 TRINITY_DN268_c0_g2_i1:439-1779(-)
MAEPDSSRSPELAAPVAIDAARAEIQPDQVVPEAGLILPDSSRSPELAGPAAIDAVRAEVQSDEVVPEAAPAAEPAVAERSVEAPSENSLNSAPNFEEGNWYIINRHSGKALTAVPFAGISPVIQLSLTPEKVQHFAFRKSDHEGCFVINCLNSGLVFDVDSGSTEDGAPVVQYRRTDGPNQSFSLEPAEDGKHFYLKAHHSGKVLEVEDGSSEEGILLVQCQKNSKDHQQFLLVTTDQVAELIVTPEITASDLINLAREGRFHEVVQLMLRLPIEKVKPLLDERPDHRRYALIHQAAWWGHVPTLKLMLDLGADVNLKALPVDDHGPETALEIATWRGNLEAVVFLKTYDLANKLSQLNVDPSAAPGSPKAAEGAASPKPPKPASTGAEDGPVAKECVVCLSTPPNCVFVPCGHMVCCVECSSALEKPQCPFCMQPVLLKQKVFL